MTREDFYRYIDRPALLTDATLPQLARIVEAFPCFHAARMLYLKNLALVGDLRLKGEIERMAADVPDRARLFLLLSDDERLPRPTNGAATPTATLEPSPADTSPTDTSPADTSPADTNTSTRRTAPFDAAASTDYLRWLTADKSTDADESTPSDADIPAAEPKMRHQDLIDSFIAHGNEQIDKRRLQRAITTPQPSEEEEEEPKAPAPKPVETAADTSYFTETLAHVYIRQKRYAKALEIIRSLSEKHPEKDIYFTDQIRFLEKLIEHDKQPENKKP